MGLMSLIRLIRLMGRMGMISNGIRYFEMKGFRHGYPMHEMPHVQAVVIGDVD